MVKNQRALDIDKLREILGQLPEPVVRPSFIMVSGLPGSGKSYLCRKLVERVPLAYLESDALRKSLFPSPDYSAQESFRLFQACHCLIEKLLQKGIPLVLDATNLEEHRREHLYHIAEKVGAKLIIVRTEAPPEVVYQRLEGRAKKLDPNDHSEAGWGIYQRMKCTVQKVHRTHFVVDTSRDITPVIDKIVREANR
jgi:hypothetical protein